jgi:diaminohydroxyphosphoribosylaminopyrimidine deaminase/5-amino-6-(5-phosphoribosylamino)uracil reductase
MTPESAMRLALAQGRRARGRTYPNPCVGAVVFRGERILGRGYTRPAGGPHAEVVALRSAIRNGGARSVRGSSMAVTLEPCCHIGRTGPCTDAILESGVRRVFVGHTDPHTNVSGRGIRRLRRGGIDVEVGVLAEGCRRLHRGFISVCKRGRPFVSLKLASTLDGRIATASGESRWITGPMARAAVHRLRARTDAILVGSQTVLADDPELTARKGDRVVHRPVRVVVDSRLRVPATARPYVDDSGGRWVVTARGASKAKRRVLTEAGVRLLDVGRTGRYLDLERALSILGEHGLTEVLVEGGGGLGAALMRAGLVDEVHWFTSPMFLGGEARAALGPLHVAALKDAWKLRDVSVRKVGDDIHVCGQVGRTLARAGRGTRR